ncbi:hypothetical protein BD289DRAFT_441274 [Coniella lustricola]|uniref:CFEM domain-containing protein n=1 Tax=Coniella lustricola TaxID=2025994 RepID=A0A2T2ZZN5_9PEZI|nr:hypothetical protein BD289DRAFT_441274 [Coniella lustricola]
MLPLRILLGVAACCLPAVAATTRTTTTTPAPSAAENSLIVRDDASDAATLAAMAAALPSCGLACVEAGALTESCTTLDCMCTSAAFSTYVTDCVASNCTVAEQLSVKNVTNSGCGVPIRDKGYQYDVMAIVLSCVSAAAFLLRMAYKLLETRVQLGLDDWCIIATMLSGAASTIITNRGTIPNGLGRDIWTLQPDMITSFAYWFYHMEYAYFLNLVLLKASILFFYLKIFPNRTVRALLWGTIIYNAIWGALFILLSIFQCQPISYYWTNWDGMHEGKCLNTNAIGWANAITSIVEDIWMVAIPLSQLSGLQLHFKKKIGVAIMFCTGTFVTIISIVRLRTLITFSNSTNVTWDNLELSQWSDIEINVGVICACMPTLRLILVKAFPVLGGSHRSAGGRYGYGYGSSGAGGRYANTNNNNNSRSMRSQGGGKFANFNTISTSGANSGAGDDDDDDRGRLDIAKPAAASGGITYQRSYAVQYDDDQHYHERSSSQIRLKELDPKGLEASTHDVSDWSV